MWYLPHKVQEGKYSSLDEDCLQSIEVVWLRTGYMQLSQNGSMWAQS